MNLFRRESDKPKYNAQRNLMGRTHYVDDDTLKFHKSRVLATYVIDDGLLFAIITSDALNWENTKRGYRYVIFDVFGTVLDRPDLKEAYSTKKAAIEAMWHTANKIDAKAHTLEAANRSRELYALEINELEKRVNA
jgi:hypothetical protein